MVKVIVQNLSTVALRRYPATVTPLTLSVPDSELHVLFHNWAEAARMESSWLTRVTPAHGTLAEERWGLRDRPLRSQTLTWLARSAEQAAFIQANLRRLTNERFPVPVYMDQSLVTQTSPGAAGSDVTVYCDTLERRLFVGQRIAIVEVDGSYQPTGNYMIRFVEEIAPDRLVVNSQLSFEVVARRGVVFPMMDVEPTLTAQSVYYTGTAILVTLTVTEVPGPSALPATDHGLPAGFPDYKGYPILTLQHDYTAQLNHGRFRDGEIVEGGRAPIPYLRGPRSRQESEIVVREDRAGGFPAVRFFDSREGRLNAFWSIDPDQFFVASAYADTHVDVAPTGLFSDFDQEWDQVGLVFKDGTHVVRSVDSVTDLTTHWRIDPTEDFPSGYSLADLERVARARLSRLKSDTLSETWRTENVHESTVAFVEILNERAATL